MLRKRFFHNTILKKMPRNIFFNALIKNVVKRFFIDKARA